MSDVPNALSVVRALLALPLVWALSTGADAVALAVFALAAASDVLDGHLARRLGSLRAGVAGDVGRGHRRDPGAYVDVGADAVFLLSGLTALWVLGALPAWVPLVAMAMLARFFATSSAGALVYDPVGRHYGTLLYVVLGMHVLGAPAAVQAATLAVLVVATCASLLGRARFLRRRTEVASRGVRVR